MSQSYWKIGDEVCLFSRLSRRARTGKVLDCSGRHVLLVEFVDGRLAWVLERSVSFWSMRELNCDARLFNSAEQVQLRINESLNVLYPFVGLIEGVSKFNVEPICEPEEVTLDNLEAAIASWEASIVYMESGSDDEEDEYLHDLYSRDCLHGILNGFASQNIAVPERLKTRIAIADKQFIELTFEIENPASGSIDSYDKNIYWYYYRWLVK